MIFRGKFYSKSTKLIHVLIKIYGINVFQSIKILKNFGFSPKIRLINLNKVLITKLENYLKSSFLIENDLKQIYKQELSEILELKIKKSFRYQYRLPVRGQRTKTNAKTVKKLKRI